jgi:uncharacterized protein YeaO (DUF488 family)
LLDCFSFASSFGAVELFQLLLHLSLAGFIEMAVHIKRAYTQPDKKDGARILVDRLWPRGLAKEKAKIDLWLKEIAPSAALRTWFGHDPDKWTEFKKRYRAELKKNDEQVAILKAAMKKGPVTLIYAAKDEEHNNAVVLRDVLNR